MASLRSAERSAERSTERSAEPEVGTGKVAEIEGVPRISSDATFVQMNFVLWQFVKITCSVITGKDFME